MAMGMVPLIFDRINDKDDDDKNGIKYDIKNNLIIDPCRRLEHIIMSNIIASRHNYE